MTTALNTLLEHAEQQRNEALALLMQAEEQVRRQQAQAQQLHAYRDEYRQRQPGRGGQGVSIELLRSHHEFMQRLEQAVQQQHGMLMNAEKRVATRRAALLALETRVASVRKLMERRSHDAQRRADRQEQRRSDDSHAQSRRGDSLRSGAFGSEPALAH